MALRYVYRPSIYTSISIQIGMIVANSIEIAGVIFFILWVEDKVKRLLHNLNLLIQHHTIL